MNKDMDLHVMFHSDIPPILYALMSGPMSGVEIGNHTGIDNSLVQRVIKTKKMIGLVERLPDKKWTLTPKGKRFAIALLQCESVLKGEDAE